MAVKNIKELRNKLCELFDGLANGSVTPAEAKEQSNAAGKISGTVKNQLEYAKLSKKIPNITFLNCD